MVGDTTETDRRSGNSEILGKKLSSALESFGVDPDSLTRKAYLVTTTVLKPFTDLDKGLTTYPGHIEALHMFIKLEDAGNKLEYSRVGEDEEDLDYGLRAILGEKSLGYFTDIGVKPEHFTREAYYNTRAVLDHLMDVMDEEKEYLTEFGGIQAVKVGLILVPVGFVLGYREKEDEVGS